MGIHYINCMRHLLYVDYQPVKLLSQMTTLHHHFAPLLPN